MPPLTFKSVPQFCTESWHILRSVELWDRNCEKMCPQPEEAKRRDPCNFLPIDLQFSVYAVAACPLEPGPCCLMHDQTTYEEIISLHASRSFSRPPFTSHTCTYSRVTTISRQHNVFFDSTGRFHCSQCNPDCSKKIRTG